MFWFVTKRLVQAIPLLAIVVILTFFMIRMAPGSPFVASAELPPEIRANLAAQYGLNLPLHEQLFRFIGAVLQGDFGMSLMQKSHSVKEIIGAGFPVSALLATLSMTLSVLVGLCLGLMAARSQNSWIDTMCTSLAVVGKTIPPMIIAPAFVTFFSLLLRWLPVQGWGCWQHLVGPVICLALYDTAAIARLMRGAALESLAKPYVMAARSKGAGDVRIFFIHVLREAILPLVSYLAPAFSGLLVGTVVVESVFNVPGLGRYLVEAAQARDFNLIIGITFLGAVCLVVFNILADVLLTVIDPRINFDR